MPLKSLVVLILALFAAHGRADCPDGVPESLPYADAIVPLSGSAGAGAEVWGCMGSNLIVRNVQHPTLTPVLPEKATANGAAVIVAPGGGFEMLSMTTEGYAVAEWLAGQGIAAFVLKYRLNETPAGFEQWIAQNAKRMRSLVEDGEGAARLPTPPEAVADAAAAIKWVRANATKLGVDPERVGLLGFSAGAMTAIAAGDLVDAASRPDFIAPIYPPMWSRAVPAHVPPMFLAIALDDDLFTSGGRPLDFLTDWQASGHPFEAHLYQSGGHGFGMDGNGAASAQWADQFYAWMDDRGLLSAGSGYSVASTSLGTLLADPAARQVIERFLPGLADNPQIKLAGSLSLEKLSAFAPELIDTSKLGAIDKALGAL